MDARRDPTAERVPGIRNPHRLEQAGVSGAVVDLDRDSVEEAGARAEDQVDGRAGNAGLLRHRVDADPLRGRLAQPVDHRVDDPPPGLGGGLRAGLLLVRADHVV